jgi:hypothetical protein
VRYTTYARGYMTQQEKKDGFIEFFYQSELKMTPAVKEYGEFNLTTHYKYMNTDADYKAQVTMGNNKVEMWLDRAEAALMVNVGKNNQKAIEYLLNNMGKGRGYGKSTEKTVEHTVRHIAEITVSDMNEDKFIEMSEATKSNRPRNQDQVDLIEESYFGAKVVVVDVEPS